MLSMKNFVNNVNCFYFQIESSFYQVINKFFKRNLLKQREFWSLIKILQIILLAISFCHFIYSFIIFIHFSFMYLFSLEGMQM